METLDQLLGGDVLLSLIRQVFPSDERFIQGIVGLLRDGDVVLFDEGAEVPDWKCERCSAMAKCSRVSIATRCTLQMPEREKLRSFGVSVADRAQCHVVPTHNNQSQRTVERHRVRAVS